MLKLLSTVKPEEIVREETQEVSGNMLIDMVSQIHLANNTLLLISASKNMEEESAMLWIFAKTVSHHHAQSVKLAKAHAKLLTSRNTTSATTTASQESPR